MSGKIALKRYKVLFSLFVVSAVLFVAVAGRVLVSQDTPEKSGVIVVLSGLEPDRPKEAAALYNAGYAGKIILTKPALYGYEVEYAREGIRLESRQELFAKLLVKKKFQSPT